MPTLKLISKQPQFTAGAISKQLHNWKKLTSDNNILSIVKGFRLELSELPFQTGWPQQLLTKPEDILIADTLLLELLQKKVIEGTRFSSKGFVSNIFIREKRNGNHRLILNLKPLNQLVEYHHFKMETLSAALQLMSPHCYMASIDLTDAYYSVNVAKSHRRFLQFQFQGKQYRFTCMANGISSAPRTFTKLLKVPLSHLREQHGIHITAYLDDLFLVATSPEQLTVDIQNTCKLLTDLGFSISPQKSSLVPSLTMQFLGFTLNSVPMEVTLAPGKADDIKVILQSAIHSNHMTIRYFAGVLGKLAATLPGNRYGMLFLKQLEHYKAGALRRHRFCYEAVIHIPDYIKTELQWWLNNIDTVTRHVHVSNPNITIFTDASLLGWGFHSADLQMWTGGRWGPQEWGQDINYLELKAVLFSLMTACKSVTNQHILIRSDNTTTVVAINRQGSTHSPNCNSMARQIWTWAIRTRNWLSAAHCQGILNTEADLASRLFNDSTEWTLDNNTFKQICRAFGRPEIDLFASRLNYKIDNYCAWLPDPGASAIDCFTLDWSSYSYVYIFPPFSLVGRCLQKILLDQADALIIVPHWPTQAWFTTLQTMLLRPPHQIRVRQGTLTLPHDPSTRHPLENRLTLWACKVSGTPTSTKGSHRK